MKKTLFGLSAVALAAAAFALPATGAIGHDESAPARQAATKIDGNAGVANPGDGALVLNFSKISVPYIPPRD